MKGKNRMDKVRIGIIGIGNMGSGHANNIKNGKCPEMELTAVADINPERLKWAEENLGFVYCQIFYSRGTAWTGA